MQPNTIAYTYDHDNDGGTTAAVSVTLTRHAEELHKSTYRTAAHMDTVLSDLGQFYRTPAKRSGNFLGVEKTSFKRTRTETVVDGAGNDTAAPSIIETSFSIPVGVSNADKLARLMEHIGFLTSSEGKAAMIKLLNVQEI
jgi:hypothetical protein